MVQKCGLVLQDIIDSRRDMSDLAIDFFLTMNHIDNVFNEPLDIYTATRRLISAMKTFLGYVEKTRENGERKTEEFVLEVLITTIYGIIGNYLAEKKGDQLVRMKIAKLANALATLAKTAPSTATSTSTTQGATPDWW